MSKPPCLIETDGADRASRSARDRGLRQNLPGERRALGENGANEAERSSLWKARRSISPSLARKAPNKLGEDITVPRSAIPEVIQRLRAISAKYGLPIVIFGHAGDGNLHPNILFDKRQPEQWAKVEQMVGKSSRPPWPWAARYPANMEWVSSNDPTSRKRSGPVSIEIQRQIKQALDPLNILNPGKIFPSLENTFREAKLCQSKAFVSRSRSWSISWKTALEAMGVPGEDAKIIADVLITSDLWGIASHGVAHLKMYYERMKSGLQLPVTRWRVVKDTPTTAVVDGGNGMGMVVGYHAMEIAMEKARQYGLGAVAVRNSSHYGVAGYYPMMAAKEGMVGSEHDQRSPFHCADVWRYAHDGDQPDRGGRSDGRGLSVRVRCRHRGRPARQDRDRRSSKQAHPEGLGYQP